MSKKHKKTVTRAYNPSYSNAMGIQGDYAKWAGGNSVTIPANVLAQMIQNLAPQKNQAKDFSPGSPLLPYQGVVPVGGPRIFAYPTGTNLTPNDRTLGLPDIPSFQQLRSFAKLYDGISLCERVILDMIPRLVPSVKIRDGYAHQGMDAKDHQKEIKQWMQFVEMPDPQQRMDIHTWLRVAWTDTTQIDALAIYKQPDRAGRLYGLNILDGSLVKPILDERGMTPQPPFPAFQQYPYGVPGDEYTLDQMLYYRESPSSFSPYGFARVERIILRVNQALRKQRKDLAHWTEGNIPAGIMEVPESSQWTPDQIDAYEQAWNALLAGNPQQQVRIKFTQPGMHYTAFEQVENADMTKFDEFLLNTAAACYGLSMGDLAFTASIHKSADEGQQNMMYRRTLYPLVSTYARLLTNVLAESTGYDFLEVTFGGFDEAEDLGAQATAYGSFVQNGILSPAGAARLMNFPEIPETGPLLVTKGGIVPLASFEVGSETRQASDAAQLAGFQLAATNPGGVDQGTDEEDGEEQDAAPKKAKQKKPQEADKDSKDEKADDVTERMGEMLARIEEELRLLRVQRALPVQRAESDRPAMLQQHTGVMVAFMLKPDEAERLALPDGEPVSDLHCTLAFLGDMYDEAQPGKLHPVRHQDTLKTILATFAGGSLPLQGRPGGITRFVNPEADTTPVVALVNASGLQDWRRRLVETLNTAGFAVSGDHDFLPHITLAYVPVGEAMPIESVPLVDLVFDTLCLAIGDDRYFFPIGDKQPVTSLERSADFRRWRQRALADIKDGKPLRAFASSAIPGYLKLVIQASLSRCSTPDHVREVFSVIQQEQERGTGSELGAFDYDPDLHIWEAIDTGQRLEAMLARGVKALRWKTNTSVSGACNPCVSNDGEVRKLGNRFPSGHRLPSCHWYCQCEVEELFEHSEKQEREDLF